MKPIIKKLESCLIVLDYTEERFFLSDVFATDKTLMLSRPADKGLYNAAMKSGIPIASWKIGNNTESLDFFEIKSVSDANLFIHDYSLLLSKAINDCSDCLGKIALDNKILSIESESIVKKIENYLNIRKFMINFISLNGLDGDRKPRKLKKILLFYFFSPD